MKYFGSGPGSEVGGYCECGRSGTCDVAGTKCNCDAKDAVLRSDDGYLDDTSYLPMHSFIAGDTGERNNNELVCFQREFWRGGERCCERH